MRKVTLICGCGRVVEQLNIVDNKHETHHDIAVLCSECDANDKLNIGYNKSSAWKYPKQGKLSAKTLAILAKGREEVAQQKFLDQYGQKPSQVGKKKR